ncbi:MAG: RNA chaperone Hfq [Firmicutes bacterium]|jgi:host factor-I protein|nr:RNA chaperone Hfq [Bacillota bacterium]HOB22526.1 RNA chaperone Hfq [Bacillota bacterium]HQD38984.1 RNA chaperone Hfq [Bacillota bacterium]
MNRQFSLQDSFLNQIRKENIPVTIFLLNGVQLHGRIRGFDNFVVLVEADGKQLMIYKHAISTLNPARPVKTEPQG